ncbi:DUF5330 domain-containing protein [Pannonibacter tanglangensis]|uniref:DUF5330 domain-containing protein n=1 Tax=Pannonibacter tanglangensis TaxID=2750084 RepID=A0ABW9ZEQ3_9HYPH|nr:DUF5330 domain-containing protein [Pannonibacter sp. XCT-34]NBN62919.1 hypothetical protein [Pannonibacter sp. XCT-34]
MFFLIRTAFWLTLVLLLIPLGTDQKEGNGINVDPLAALMAAQATVSDLSGFCDRNPQACETGGQALTAIGTQARDGARIVYEFLDKSVADGATSADPAAAPGSALPGPVQHGAGQPGTGQAATGLGSSALPGPAFTGSVPRPGTVTGPVTGSLTGTLTAADAAPAWHLPAPETLPGAAPAAPSAASSVPEAFFGPVPRPNPRSGNRV